MKAKKELLKEFEEFVYKVRRDERRQGERPSLHDFTAEIFNKYNIEYIGVEAIKPEKSNRLKIAIQLAKTIEPPDEHKQIMGNYNPWAKELFEMADALIKEQTNDLTKK